MSTQYEGLAVLQVGSTGEYYSVRKGHRSHHVDSPPRAGWHNTASRRACGGAMQARATQEGAGSPLGGSSWHGVEATTLSRFPPAAQVLDDCLSPHDDGDLRTFIEQLFDDWPQQPCEGFTAATSPRPPQQRKQPPQVVLCRVPGCRASITGA